MNQSGNTTINLTDNNTTYTRSNFINQACDTTSNVTFNSIQSAGNITAYYNSSDLALKDNIEVIPNALEKVMSLDGINWTYKNDGRKMTGLIAQQLQKVLPNAVYEANVMDEDGHLAIRYGNVVGLLVESIKELSEKVKKLGG